MPTLFHRLSFIPNPEALYLVASTAAFDRSFSGSFDYYFGGAAASARECGTWWRRLALDPHRPYQLISYRPGLLF